MNKALSLIMVSLMLVSAFSLLTTQVEARPTWVKYVNNPVLDIGPSGSWEDLSVWSCDVIFDGTTYKMWYNGGTSNQYIRIGYATSADGMVWTRYPANPVLDVGSPSSWDDLQVSSPSVVFDGSIYRMWYSGNDGGAMRIGLATSPDGVTWTKYAGNPVLTASGWEGWWVLGCSVIFDGSTYKMWYTGYDGSKCRIGYATSTDGIIWTKHPSPVLDIGSLGSWDSEFVRAPSVIFDGSIYHMWYEGNDDRRHSKIGYATSTDGISWDKQTDNPVIELGPEGSWDDWSIGQPTAMRIGSSLKMWYSGHDGTNTVSSPTYHVRIGLATSPTPPLTSLMVNVFDESGFPPASSGGARRLADIPVKVYTLDDTLMADGVTNPSGTVSFNLAEDSYRIVYGGIAIDPRGGSAYGVASKTVDVSGSSMSIDLYCFSVTFHSYEAGGPYELDYIDLDRATGDHERTLTVEPGQRVDAEFSWWELETRNVPVWYVSVFGSWSETSALGNLRSGCASPSAHRLHTVPLSFIAPTTPGTYEVRLLGVLDYTWPNSYYTAAHYNPSLGRDMGIGIIGKGVDEPYGIGTIIVGAEPDFEISGSPSSQSLLREESVEYEITVTSVNGFNDEVTLSASAQPGSFLYCDVSPKKVTPLPDGSAQSILTVIATEFGSVGTEVVEVIATSGEKERRATVTVLVDMVDGIETVISFESYTTAISLHSFSSFSVQQNFWIKGGLQRYWAQNIIWIWPLTNRMAGIFEIYNYTYPDLGVRIVAWWMYYRSGSALDTVTLRSTIEGNALAMTNDYSAMTWNFPSDVTDDWFIQTVKRSSAEDNRPELVLVGPMKALVIGGHVDFLDPTSGNVDTYVRTAVSNEWSRGVSEVIQSPEGSSTGETSSGLKWNSAGDFEYESGSRQQGLKFTYDYEGGSVIPPSVSAATGNPASLMAIHASCPVNLSLYDPFGKHTGYNTQTGEVDLRIPDTFYYFSEESEYLIVITPSEEEYRLSIVGTGDGGYTLQVLWQNEIGEMSMVWISSGDIVEGAVYHYGITIIDQIAFVRPDAVAELEHLKDFINGLPDDSFNRPRLTSQRKNALFNKIDEVVLKVEAGNYTDAINKLFHDIRAKMDGDSTAMDWIIDPETQIKLCVIIDHIISSIETLQQE